MTYALAMSDDTEEQEVRSNWRDRTPVDEVAPQHADVHALLIRWGNWNRERSKGGSLAPLYSTAGTPPTTTPTACDPLIIETEKCVLRMPKKYATILRDLYVYRCTPYSICDYRHLRFEAWFSWVFRARAMVVNLLRRHGVA
jgi:hypothetical protein